MTSTVSFLQGAGDTSNVDAYTFTSQNFGTAGSGRYIICAVASRRVGTNATSISSVTIGGVTATEVIQAVRQVSNTSIAGLFIAAVPTGTSGTVAVNFSVPSDTMVRCIISLYSSLDLESATPYDTASSAANDPSAAIDIPAGGFAIGVGTNGANTTCTWTNLTENYDAVTETSQVLSTASDNFASAQSALTITADFASNSEDVGVFASFGVGGGGGPTVKPLAALGVG